MLLVHLQVNRQVLGTVTSTNDPFFAVVRVAFLPSPVCLAMTTPTVNRIAAFRLALRAATMADAVPPAFLHICTAFKKTTLPPTMSFTELKVLCGSIAAFHATEQLSSMTTASLVHLADLVTTFDNALAPSTMGNAMTTSKVVLGASNGATSLSRSLVLGTDSATNGPVLAVLYFTFLPTSMALTKATATVDFRAVFRLAFLPTTVRDAKASSNISLTTSFKLAKSTSTVSFTMTPFHSLILTPFNRTKGLTTMPRAVPIALYLLRASFYFALLAPAMLDTVTIALVELGASWLLAELAELVNRTATIQSRRHARTSRTLLPVIAAAILPLHTVRCFLGIHTQTLPKRHTCYNRQIQIPFTSLIHCITIHNSCLLLLLLLRCCWFQLVVLLHENMRQIGSILR